MSLPFEKFVKSRETIERIVVVGPNSKQGAVFDQLYAAGFTIRAQGPYTNRRMFPKVDAKRFMCHAERRVSDAT